MKTGKTNSVRFQVGDVKGDNFSPFTSSFTGSEAVALLKNEKARDPNVQLKIFKVETSTIVTDVTGELI